MGYRPLYNKVLLQLEKQTTALIVEPDLQKAVKGVIISVGIKKQENLTATEISGSSTPILNAGDKVWFFIRDTKKFKINNEEFYLISDEDILVIEKI